MQYNSIPLPRQRLPYSQKNKEWRVSVIEHADQYSFYNNEKVRQTLHNKLLNLNLYNGIVDVRDLTNTVNPYNMNASFVPDNIPHHPILVPKVDLLVGEEIKRRFDYYAIVTNPDAISSKEDDKKTFLFQRLSELYQGQYQEKELEAKMKDLEKYMKYSWQDLREKMANQILRHYSQEQSFDLIFNEGFKDALIMAEEIYQIDIVQGEPTLRKLNPLKVHAVRSGNSDKIEDSSLIILEDHWSPNKIVDYYHDQLKPKDIDYILEYSTDKHSGGSYSDDHNNHVLMRDSIVTGTPGAEDTYNNLFEIAEINGHFFSRNCTDETGNIRVLQVYWKSLKKIKKVKYYDEFGETQYKIVSEEYIEDKTLGEEVQVLWVNEWWEGVKIGKDIYVNLRPRPVQFNRLSNPSICHPGIVGQIYNTNQGRAVSLVDRCKNYQYLYDAIWDRLNKAIASNYGKIMQLDFAKMPDGWEVEKWMHFAVVNKVAVTDSFKEGQQGAALGKIAGGLNNNVGSGVIDMETGNYIQQHVQLLEFIKMEMGEIAGVSQQRQGQISNRETVGGVERSVNQSSHITEWWFMKHEQTKLRVLTAFLETAKVALKDNNKKIQYILDDQTIEVLNLESDEFCECDYGIVLSSAAKTMELEQLIKGNAQAILQNGGSLSTIMDIYLSPSLLDMRRKIEEAEDLTQERQSEQAKQQNETAQQDIQARLQSEQAERDLKDLINQRDNDTKYAIALLNSNEEVSDDGIMDPLENEKLNLDKEKVKNDHLTKIKALQQDMEKHKDNVELKKESNQISRIKKVTK